MAMIKDNIFRLKKDISLVCRRLGRDPQQIALVGVTKYAQSIGIIEALQIGLTHIAENKIQEAKEKFAAIDFSKYPVTRHMIGHLQTNKVKDALKLFDMIQSLDSMNLAEAIERQAGVLGRTVDVLVQINISKEVQKFGVDPQEASPFIERLATFKYLNVLGVMGMAPTTDDEEIIRNCFRGLREFRDNIEAKFKGSGNIQMKFLSMGMSRDYRIALEEGSNMLRIGSLIFK